MSKRRSRLLPAWWRAVRASSCILFFVSAAVILTTWGALQVIEPAPPALLSIPTGSADGSYWHFGRQLALELEQQQGPIVMNSQEETVQALHDLKNGSFITEKASH